MNDNSKMNDVVDTTDCLEAIGACKGIKNLSFIIVLICLLLLQGVFWLNTTGYIDSSQETAVIVDPVSQDVADNQIDKEIPPANKMETTEETQAKTVVEDITGEQDKIVEDETPEVASEEPAKINIAKFLLPKYDQAVIIVRICNFALILAATLYSLVLLISLKISLVGRLGGISHISRAFFLSLVALVILMPWQIMFEGVCLGAIYTPAELSAVCTSTDCSTLVCSILYYLRFSGMWLLVLLLFLTAQCRSAKWAKTTLRRLGVIR